MQLAGKNLAHIVHIVMFKSLVGKILAGLDKSAKIFHHQNFALYGNYLKFVRSATTLITCNLLFPFFFLSLFHIITIILSHHPTRQTTQFYNID